MGKYNVENLIPANERTPSERREIARKAGKASGKARQEKKTLQECVNFLLNAKAPANSKKPMELFGVPDNMQTNKMLMVVNLYKLFLNGKLDAGKMLFDITGEMPAATVKMDVSQTVQNKSIDLSGLKPDEVARLTREVFNFDGKSD